MTDTTPKRARGPDKAPRKQRPKMKHTTMRLPENVVEFFGGSSIRMRAVLEQYVSEKSLLTMYNKSET